MKLNRIQIGQMAIQILDQNPEGLRWSDWLRKIENEADETPHNSLRGGLHWLVSNDQETIRKVAKGTYQLEKYVNADIEDSFAKHKNVIIRQIPKIKEEEFYELFAKWLVDNDEATIARKLGGASLGGKWGTPDIIGVLKPQAKDIFKFQPQIITAEIKTAAGETVVAFGQAIAYRLFSHKSYIVVPNNISSDDLNRLKSLCTLHGVGLVTFNLDKLDPNFTVIVIPAVAEPDMFYVNSMLNRLRDSNEELLNLLF